LFKAGVNTGALGLALVSFVLIYDALHKRIAYAPVLMGLCRLFLYVTAASVNPGGVTDWAVWCGLALAIYIVGLSMLARGEAAAKGINHLWLALLAAPIVLALMMNANVFRKDALVLSALVAVWLMRSLRSAFRATAPDIGAAVSGLLAGIVFVDWLAAADAPRQLGIVFVVLICLALLLQRWVPAT
jgi:4-hydroxybenzoate polyprenyltransferase